MKKASEKLKQATRRSKYKQESRLLHILILLDYTANLEQQSHYKKFADIRKVLIISY